MARTYTKLKRAEQETETRLRIADAALALHGEIGPARTTISMIAERAGVQRHTVYAHFPDEPSILLACSGLHLQREPLPVPAMWESLNDPRAKLRVALAALYAWYARNASVAAAVLRDAEISAPVRDIVDKAMGAPMGAILTSLSDGLPADAVPRLRLAMSFYTWRTLVAEAGLSTEAAIDAMEALVIGATR